MIISEKHGFTFIHNPKVAGTTVRLALQGYHDHHTTFWHQRYETKLGRTVDMAHIPYDDLDEQVKRLMAHTFNFGFVRHPVSRFYSAWAEFKRQHADWQVSKLDVNDFVERYLTQANVRYDWRFVHFTPQHYFFYSGNKRIADFIGLHERFKDDWVAVQALAGLMPGPLSNNRHRDSPLFPDLTVETRALLQNLYQRDFLLFGYNKPFIDLVNKEGVPVIDTHWQRVELIHNPMNHCDVVSTMTAGEKMAHLQNTVDYLKKRTGWTD
jgi:hypothetical protein